MKQHFTRFFSLIVLVLWLGNASISFAQQTAPADTSKKKEPPPPPAQMVQYSVFSDISKIRLNSYTQIRFQYYEKSTDANGNDNTPPSSFDLRNTRLIFNATPMKNFSYRLQVDFAPPTVRALDAYASYTFWPYLKVTVGQQKVPLSYESLRTDYDIHSVSRSQAVEALTARSKDVLATANSATPVNNNGRDIGVVASGGIPNNNTGINWVDYAVGVVDGEGINVSDPDKHKDIGARVVVHPLKELQVGGSIYDGKATYGVDRSTPKTRDRYGFDAAYEGKWLYAAAEYLAGTDSATKRGGYYAMAEGFYIPKKASVLLKYDFYDPNKDKDADATTITSVALNYYFAAFTKVQLQYDFRHENDAETQKKNNLLSIQAQIYF